MMEEDNVDVLDLPWTDAWWDLYKSLDNGNDSFVNQREFMVIIFDKNKQSSQAGKQPQIANKIELQMTYLRWLKENDP